MQEIGKVEKSVFEFLNSKDMKKQFLWGGPGGFCQISIQVGTLASCQNCDSKQPPVVRCEHTGGT